MQSSDNSQSQPRKEQSALIQSFQCWKRLHWCRSKITSAFQITSLMALFSVMAAAELPLPEDVSDTNLLIAFVVTTSLLVSITVTVKMVSISILPHLDTIAEMSVNDAMSSPHDSIIDWIFYTCILGHTVAPVLFCIDMVLISWLKFPKFAKDAPLAVTAIMTPMIVIILGFGCILWKQMRQFKATEFYPFPNRRYSEIAETWDADSNSLSRISISSDEESQLVKSQRSVTSYGAVIQNEYTGPPSTIFADFCHQTRL